jgi:hypothetical protein
MREAAASIANSKSETNCSQINPNSEKPKTEPPLEHYIGLSFGRFAVVSKFDIRISDFG